MPVCVRPFPIKPKLIQSRFAKSALQLMKTLWPDGGKQELIQTSFDDEVEFPSTVIPRANGFVDTVVEAYNEEHCIQFRPEDVWFAILTQFSLYVTSHSEEVRDKFVSHQGKKELVILYDSLHDSYAFDFGVFAKDMGLFLETQVTDPSLREWMMPSFTTTTDDDIVVASIIMMGTLRNYFNYSCYSSCGIPSVTLLGEKGDYTTILSRLDRLEMFGEEPARFAALLKPILKRMIRTFEDPNGAATKKFWKQILDVDSGSGFHTYSGWIVAFCFWDKDGKCLALAKRPKRARSGILLDGVQFHTIEKDQVPPGWTTAPVSVRDRYRCFEAEMLAGSIGTACSQMELARGLDTMQPVTAWAIYETKQPR